MTIDEMIDKKYDELFDFICRENDDLFDLVVEYKDLGTGKTIRRSWQERNERLRQEEKQ